MIDESSLNELKNLLGSDFPEFIVIFITDSRERLKRLKKAIEQNNITEIKVQTHSLKGSSGSLYATLMSERCFKLEICSNQNRLQDAAAIYQTIYDEFENVEAELNQYWL